MLILAMLLAGCTRDITVSQQPYTPQLALESLLTPGEVPRVYLSTTVPFFTTVQTPSSLFVNDATVVILGPDGADMLQVDSTYSRFWCRWEPYYQGSIPVRFGERYQLSVTHGGETYQAETVTDVPAVTISQVSYVTDFVDIYGGHEGVVVDFNDLPGRADQYRFEMERVLDERHETVDAREYGSTCLEEGEQVVQSDIGRFIYFDGRLDGAPVRFVVEPSHTNYEGDEAMIYIQSLSRNAADFYDRLDRQREANINPFVEPVFLETQIPGMLGVFGVMIRSQGVPFVFPQDSA